MNAPQPPVTRRPAPRTRVLTGDRCQCGGCGAYFNSTAAHEKHRVGKGGNRRCLTPDEMRAKGMVLSAKDWWLTKAGSRPFPTQDSPDTSAAEAT